MATIEFGSQTEGVEDAIRSLDKLSVAQQRQILSATAGGNAILQSSKRGRRGQKEMTTGQVALNSAMVTGKNVLGQLGVGFGVFELGKAVIADMRSEMEALLKLQTDAAKKQEDFGVTVAQFTKSTTLSNDEQKDAVRFAKEHGAKLGEGGPTRVLQAIENAAPKSDDLKTVLDELEGIIKTTGKHDPHADFSEELLASARLAKAFQAPGRGQNLLAAVVAGGGATANESIGALPGLIPAAEAAGGTPEAAAKVLSMFQIATKENLSVERSTTALNAMFGKLAGKGSISLAGQDVALSGTGLEKFEQIEAHLATLDATGREAAIGDLVTGSGGVEAGKLVRAYLRNRQGGEAREQTLLGPASTGERDFVAEQMRNIEDTIDAEGDVELRTARGMAEAALLESPAKQKANIAEIAAKDRKRFGLVPDEKRKGVAKGLGRALGKLIPRDASSLFTVEFPDRDDFDLAFADEIQASDQMPKRFEERLRARLRRDVARKLGDVSLAKGQEDLAGVSEAALRSGRISGQGGRVSQAEFESLRTLSKTKEEEQQLRKLKKALGSGEAGDVERIVAGLTAALVERLDKVVQAVEKNTEASDGNQLQQWFDRTIREVETGSDRAPGLPPVSPPGAGDTGS